MAVGRSKNAGMCRPERGDLVGAREGGRRHDRDPQPAVGGEALLRREVVGVHLGQVDGEATGARGRVDEHEGTVVGAGRSAHGRHHAGGGLVVGPGIGVDARLGDRCRQRARVGLDHRRGGEPRRLLGGLGELGGELPEGQVLALLADQAGGGDIPERRGAAVAEHHLVPLGQREQRGQALAHPADQVADRRLPVGGSHQRGAGRRQRVEVRGLDLGGSGAEAAVGRLQLRGDRQDIRGGVSHETAFHVRVEGADAVVRSPIVSARPVPSRTEDLP